MDKCFKLLIICELYTDLYNACALFNDIAPCTASWPGAEGNLGRCLPCRHNRLQWRFPCQYTCLGRCLSHRYGWFYLTLDVIRLHPRSGVVINRRSRPNCPRDGVDCVGVMNSYGRLQERIEVYFRLFGLSFLCWLLIEAAVGLGILPITPP